LRREGEVSISEAALMVEVHVDTMREWAKNALVGMPSRLRLVRRDVVGRYWLDRTEVLRIAHESE
jgi:hypothetical protein